MCTVNAKRSVNMIVTARRTVGLGTRLRAKIAAMGQRAERMVLVMLIVRAMLPRLYPQVSLIPFSSSAGTGLCFNVSC
jgi:hypothetical protein